jgi:hypothetical protein
MWPEKFMVEYFGSSPGGPPAPSQEAQVPQSVDVFGRFSARRVQKHHKHIFCKKSMSEKKIYKNFDVSFSSTFFRFIAFWGVFQRWEFKNSTKNGLQNKSCRKVFTKSSTKNPKPTFSRFVFSRFLGVSR